MKIDYSSQKALMDAYLKNNVQNVQNIQQNQSQQEDTGKNGAVQGVARSDRVELSEGSRLIQKVEGVMNAEDPGRAEHVNMIKEQVASGTYKITPEKVAESMLNDMIKNMG